MSKATPSRRGGDPGGISVALCARAAKGMTMGKSFFFGTDAQLYTGSNSFTDKIVLAPTSYGLSAPQAAAYQTLNDIYSGCYLAALDPETRTKSKVKAKNDSKTL